MNEGLSLGSSTHWAPFRGGKVKEVTVDGQCRESPHGLLSLLSETDILPVTSREGRRGPGVYRGPRGFGPRVWPGGAGVGSHRGGRPSLSFVRRRNSVTEVPVSPWEVVSIWRPGWGRGGLVRTSSGSGVGVDSPGHTPKVPVRGLNGRPPGDPSFTRP